MFVIRVVFLLLHSVALILHHVQLNVKYQFYKTAQFVHNAVHMTKVTVKFNVAQLIRELSLRNRRDYDKTTLATEINVSRTSLYGILGNSNVRIDLPTVEKLIAFFHAEGMPVTLEQLFTVEYPTEPTTSPTSAKSTN